MSFKLKPARIDVFIPCNDLTSFPWSSTHGFAVAWKDALEQFLSIPHQVFESDPHTRISDISVTKLDDERAGDFRSANRIRYVQGIKCLGGVAVFQISASLAVLDLSQPPDFSEEEAQSDHDQWAAQEFGLIVRRFLVAALIAHAGILYFDDIFITQNRMLWERETDLKGIGVGNLELSRKLGWPTIGQLNIFEVWKWLQGLTNFNNDFGSTRLGRAVAAFTHIIKERRVVVRGESLLWSLLGLESIYTRGNADLTNQLTEKTQLLLGPQKDFKKLVKKMYDYRSRFAHGDIGIPMIYHTYDAQEHYEEYAEEMDEASDIAENVLVASLQQMALRGWHDLNFEWKMTGETAAAPKAPIS